MISVALQLPEFMSKTVRLNRIDDIFELVVEVFAEMVEERIANGLYRWYVEREENLPAIRGRICFAEDLRQNYIQRQRAFCRFEDFTWDIPENQILRQVAHALSGGSFSSELRARLRQIDTEFYEVSRTRFTSADVRKIQYHRLNEAYRDVHKLCELLLEDASLSESFGQFGFRSFLIDMNRLFEQFVTQILIDHRYPDVTICPQQSVHLDKQEAVEARPDLLLNISNRAVLVADCKYKKIDQDEFKNSDIYQLIAYNIATKCNRGLLIYPLHEVSHDQKIEVTNTDIELRQVTIDLCGDLTQLKASCKDFADKAFRFASGTAGFPLPLSS